MMPDSISSASPAFKLLVLISGSGTNLQALIDACRPPPSSSENLPPSPSSPLRLPPDTAIIHVISNRKDAYGLTRARLASIPTTYHNLLSYKKRHPPEHEDTARLEYDTDLANLITQHHPDLVVCAGFMHVLSPTFLQLLRSTDPPIEIINLHPALPGQFNGTDAIARAWHAFQRGDIASSGVMVHRVVEEVDMGEPLVVRDVGMIYEETLSEFEQRVHEVEWVAIVEGTNKALEAIQKTRMQRQG